MFPQRFFPGRYFTSRYFSKIGGAPPLENQPGHVRLSAALRGTISASHQLIGSVTTSELT